MADPDPTGHLPQTRSLDGEPIIMALASQSSRSGSRRAYMTSRRRRSRGRWLLMLLMLAAIAVGGWWWFGEDHDATNVEPPMTREPAPAVIDMASEPAPPRKSLDPVSGDPDVALGNRGGRIGNSSRTTDSSSSITTRPTTPVTSPEPETISEPVEPVSNPVPATVVDSRPAVAVSSPEPAAPSEAGPKNKASKTETGSTLSRAMKARNRATTLLSEARDLADRDPIAARQALSEAWISGLSEDDRRHAAMLSRTLADRTILMGPDVPVSPWTRTYTIRPSDTLGGIIFGQKVATSQSFIALINGLDDPNAIKANKPLLLPNGRFHAVVDLGSRDVAVFQELDGGRRDLLMVMPIALGPNLEAGLDPMRDKVTGLYRVRPQGMRRNPSWKNPATGKMWQRGDVGNPVGEHWISLEALERLEPGTGSRPPVVLHGTAPDLSIESGRHPGLVALEPGDIELLYLMLDTGDSTIDIRR